MSILDIKAQKQTKKTCRPLNNVILGCGDTRASEDLHFPQVEATIYVHLVILVLREIEGGGGQYCCYWWIRRGLFRRSQKEVRLPRSHFSIDEDRPDGKVVCKKPKWSLETLCPFFKKSPPVLFTSPFTGIFPESRPFKTDGSTSQKTPRICYEQEKRAAFPSATFHWTPSPPLTTTPRPSKMPIKRGGKIRKGQKLGKRLLIPRPLFRREEATTRLRPTHTRCFEVRELHHAARSFFLGLSLAEGENS